MVSEAIAESVKRYLRVVNDNSIPVRYGVVFGSQAKGTAHQWSDIDLIVVSPVFDGQRKHRDVALLWRLTVTTDNRIEPIPVGERQWAEDDSSLIIEVARREGGIVTV